MMDVNQIGTEKHRTPSYEDYVNYIAKGVFPPQVSWQQRKRIMHESRNYIWEDPYVFR